MVLKRSASLDPVHPSGRARGHNTGLGSIEVGFAGLGGIKVGCASLGAC